MVRVLRVSGMPKGVLMWVRPTKAGHVMYLNEQALGDGYMPPWKTGPSSPTGPHSGT
jgi:hypothetical protein